MNIRLRYYIRIVLWASAFLVDALGASDIQQNNNDESAKNELCGKSATEEDQMFEAAKSWEQFCELVIPSNFLLIRGPGGCYLEHVAAKYGQDNLLEFIKQCNSDNEFLYILGRRDFKGWTALHHACNADQLSSVKYLLNEGAFFDARANGFLTPEMIANENSKIFMKNVAKLFKYACDNKEPQGELLDLLKENLFLVSEEEGTLLQSAVMHGSSIFIKKIGSFPVIKKYLKHVDANGHTPLWWALKLGYEKLAGILFSFGAEEISAKEFECAFYNDRTVFLNAMDFGSSFFQRIYENKLLHEAIGLKSIKLLKWLLSCPGLDPSQKVPIEKSDLQEDSLLKALFSIKALLYGRTVLPGAMKMANLSPLEFVGDKLGKLTFKFGQKQALCQLLKKPACDGRPDWKKKLDTYSKMHEILFNAEQAYKERQQLFKNKLLSQQLLIFEHHKKLPFLG